MSDSADWAAYVSSSVAGIVPPDVGLSELVVLAQAVELPDQLIHQSDQTWKDHPARDRLQHHAKILQLRAHGPCRRIEYLLRLQRPIVQAIVW